MLMFNNSYGVALACGNKWIQVGTYRAQANHTKVWKSIFCTILVINAVQNETLKN